MDDTCAITRDAPADDAEDLDPDTGILYPPIEDDGVVYDDLSTGIGGRELGGRCKVAPLGYQDSSDEQGGHDIYAQTYQGSIPWDAPVPQRGDILTVNTSRRDPALVNAQFTVRKVLVTTMLVSRKMVLERR